MYTSTAFAAVALSLLGSVNGHMTMKSPAPYSKVAPQNSPLDGTTYAFPCQGGTEASYYEGSTATEMPVGQSQTLSFTGSAVHGGGSCQLSITYESPPPADQSKWKVIKSIIGGCPAQAAGNLASDVPCGNDSGTECVREFSFDIPEKMKNGNATLAWTWFNKIGNREIYMNCAPISISGGADDDSYYDSLPDMFVANLPGKCTTGDGVLEFPNPGTILENGGEVAVSAAIGSCDTGLNAAAGLGSGSASIGVSLSIGLSTAAASTAAASTASNTGGIFAPGAASGASYTSTSLATVVVSTTVASATPVAATTAAPAAAAGTGSASCVSCSTDGAVVCIGTTQFGLCNRGCAVPQALAAGTTCSGGTISKRDTGKVIQRSHARRHARQHHRAALVQRNS